MVSKEHLEVRVILRMMQFHIDIVIVSTGIRGILNFIELYESKIFTNLNSLCFSIVLNKIANNLLTHISKTTDEKLSDQNGLIELRWA